MVKDGIIYQPRMLDLRCPRTSLLFMLYSKLCVQRCLHYQVGTSMHMEKKPSQIPRNTTSVDL